MASNIKVALTLDDRDYQTKLKAAESATKAFGASGISSMNGLKDAFVKLSSGADALKSKMELLGGAIAGMAFGAFISNLLHSSAAVKDLSEAFGLTLESTLELEAGFRKAGKSTDDMARMLANVSQSAQDANDGSYGLREAFGKFGLSMDDLKKRDLPTVLKEIATVMRDNAGNTEILTAGYNILGKAAKGMPMGDLVAGIEASSGKMGAAATATEAFDTALKTMESSAAGVTREFKILVTPIVEAFNALSEGSDHAKLAAEVLAGAMAVVGGALVINGIRAVIGAYASLASAIGLSAAASALDTAATTANTTAQGFNNAVRQAGLAAKVESLAAELAIAEAKAVSTAGTIAEAGALKTVESLTWRLAVAKGALAEATTVAAATQGGAAVAATGLAAAEGTAAVATTSLAASMGALMVTMAPILIAVAALGTLWVLYKQNSQEAAASTDVMLGAMDDSAFGTAIMNADEMAKKVEQIGKKAETSAEVLKRLGVAANTTGGRMVAGGPQAQPGEGVAVVSTDNRGNQSVLGDQKTLNPMAATEESLRAQARLRELNLKFDKDRLDLQIKMIGKDDETKAVEQSALDFKIKKQQEIQRLTDDILRMEIQSANEKDAGSKYGGQLSIMRQQLQVIKDQKDTTTGLIAELEKAKLLDKARLSTAELIRSQYEKSKELTLGGAKRGKSPLEQQIMDIRESYTKMGEDAVRSIDEMFKGRNMEDPEIFKAYTDEVYKVKAGFQELSDKQVAGMGVSKDFATSGIDDLKSLQDELRSGMMSAWDEYKTKANDTAGQIKGTFGTFTSGMEDAFVKFVQTGKLSFADLANSIIADLVRIAVRKAVVFAMSGGTSSLFGFANGGSVMSGTPIVVGERGPELFVPQSAGKIVNNSTLNGSGSNDMGNNQPTVVNYNIQAVDASSFRSLVARDPSFIYAVTEQGRRGQPTRKLA